MFQSLRNLLLLIILIPGSYSQVFWPVDLRWVLDIFIFNRIPKGFQCRLFKKYSLEDTDGWTQSEITKERGRKKKKLPICFLPSTTLPHSWKNITWFSLVFCLSYLLLNTLTSMNDLENMILTDHISLASVRYSYEVVAEIYRLVVQ